MRFAIIDLGTNSVRFDVHQLSVGSKTTRVLHREKLMVRLGQNVFLSGKLDPDAIARTLDAFHHFAEVCSSLKVDRIQAFATSALREASDRDKLIKRVEKETGIYINIISGAEEARLIALGMLKHYKSTRGRFAFIDIGGGSTEVTICEKGKILKSDSFQLGTARLQQIFLKKSPPEAASVAELRLHIQSLVMPKIIQEKWGTVDTMIGSSGTIKAVSRILKETKGKKNISRKDLQKLVKQMASMNTTQLLSLPGLEAKRVDMILSGTLLLEECMNVFSVKKTLTTDFSLRDGILERELQLLKQTEKASVGVLLPDLMEKAKHFGQKEETLKLLATNAEFLFNKLQKIHRLESKWKDYLIAAAFMKNTGEFISITQSEEHAYYIAKNVTLPFLDEWEAELIALLCKHHENGKVDQANLNSSLKPTLRKDFVKLLALLRVLDALEMGNNSLVKIKSVKCASKRVLIQYTGRVSSGLEQVRMDRRKPLFEEVFRRSLHIKKS